jgi:hypothetical protein
VSAVSAYWVISADLLRGDLLRIPELSFTSRQLSGPGPFIATPRCTHLVTEKSLSEPIVFVNKKENDF